MIRLIETKGRGLWFLTGGAVGDGTQGGGWAGLGKNLFKKMVLFLILSV